MVKAEVQKTDTEKVIEEEKVHLKGQKETVFSRCLIILGRSHGT